VLVVAVLKVLSVKLSTYKVVGIIVRGALFVRHDGCSQSSGGARDGQKLSVAHVGPGERSAGRVLGYGEKAWRRELQAIGEWINTIYGE
jgi:hypothetical protein